MRRSVLGTTPVENTHQSHELRLTSNEDYRVRGTVGAYWEKFVIDDR